VQCTASNIWITGKRRIVKKILVQVGGGGQIGSTISILSWRGGETEGKIRARVAEGKTEAFDVSMCGFQ
jgi:hypothetical protein